MSKTSNKIDMDNKKSNRGGARVGSGRKKLNKTMLHTSIDISFLGKLREKADSEHLTVGDWLVKHIEL